MSRVRSLVLLILVPFITLFSSFLAAFIYAPFLSKRQCDNLIKYWSKILLWLSNVKTHVSGLENLSVKSAILISNHLSLFDIPVLYANLPVSFRMAAKVELFKIPIFGNGLRAFGFFPIERQNPENAAQAFKAMEKRFEEGASIWMAPEGTRQSEIEIGPFKMGAFVLALKAKQSIIPITIYGTQKVLPKNSLFINWGSWSQDVYAVIGKPISSSQWTMETRHEFRDYVRHQMEETFAKLKIKGL
jgi:1-acyl-sn-glycerol-3-phosphate acyltransferase